MKVSVVCNTLCLAPETDAELRSLRRATERREWEKGSGDSRFAQSVSVSVWMKVVNPEHQERVKED